jgi:hypothetical protein
MLHKAQASICADDGGTFLTGRDKKTADDNRPRSNQLIVGAWSSRHSLKNMLC